MYKCITKPPYGGMEVRMNSYTIKIADYDLRLRCDLSPEALDAIVKKVDGYITAMCARSNNISKTEAAILCALEFCSACDQVEQSKDQNDGEREQLVEENKKAAAQISKLEARLEQQKQKYEDAAAAQKERYDAAVLTQKEKYEGRIENMKEKYETRIAQLKSKVDELRNNSTQQMSMDIPASAPDSKNETDTAAADTPAADQPDQPVTEAVSAAPAVEATAAAADTAGDAAPAAVDNAADKSKKSKNKVGSMFELLTFGDV